jgi:hypothetical protein
MLEYWETTVGKLGLVEVENLPTAVGKSRPEEAAKIRRQKRRHVIVGDESD